MGEKADKKWKGSVTHVIGAPIENVWPVLADFGGLGRHFPKIIPKCDIIEGEGNKVGAVRYLELPKTTDFTFKVKERLVVLDDPNYKFTYNMEENNAGWKDYFAHVALQSAEKNQTQVDWSFDVNPLPNLTEEEYVADVSQLFHALLKDLMAQATQW